MSEQLFSVAGIVTDDKGRTKVRYCNDLVGRIKLFTKNKQNKRVDFVELPSPMSKIEAVKFLLTHDTFQSQEDQCFLNDNLIIRTPKEPRKPKEKIVKTSKSKKEISLDSIRQRKKNVTPEEILSMISSTEEAPL